MTSPTASQPAARRSPFAGQLVHTLLGMPMDPAAHHPRFDEPVWNLAGLRDAPTQLKPSQLVLDFTGIPHESWRQVARELMIALMCPTHERVALLAMARRTPLSLRTCQNRLFFLVPWLQWLAGQGVTSLRQVDQDHCEAYLAHRHATRPNTATALHDVLPLKDLAAYGEVFTSDSYQPGFIPWRGRTAAEVAGVKSGGENKTPPVTDEILRPALHAGLYLVQVIGPHLVALQDQIRAARPGRPSRSVPRRDQFGALMSRYLAAGRPLPQLDDHHIAQRLVQGWDPHDRLLAVSFAELARELDIRQFHDRHIQAVRDLAEHAVARVGAAPPWARDAVTVPAANDTGPVAWTLPLTARQTFDLAAIVFTASLFVTSAVSGMRSGELMELTASACAPPVEVKEGLFRFALAGKRIKNEQWGGVTDEWVVIEPAYRAVQLAARLAGTDPSTGTPIFGRFNFVNRMRALRNWINGPAGVRLGLAPIPPGRVTTSMLRRTLALELARRPHGLLAAKTHLKHISVATTECYTRRPGGSQARFHAEVAAEEATHNRELAAAVYRDYQAGKLPAGPGARALIDTFRHVDEQLAGLHQPQPTVVATDRHIELLLKKKAATLHVQAANYCWFTDPAQALCLRMAGTPTATAPLAGLCDATRCPQATFHPEHREVWAGCAASTTTFLGNPRIPAGEATRLRAEHARTQRVVEAIDAATNGGTDR